MKLTELPSMLVERVERDEERTTVHGRFDRLDGVRESGGFRLRRGEYAWASLVIVDRASYSVLVAGSADDELARLEVGERYIWLATYWDMPFVEAVADESTVWRRFELQPTDAQYFRQGDVVGWREVGSELPEGAASIGVKPGGWDHEHCDLCDAHIDARNPIGYTNDDGYFLCSRCYERYGTTHDVSFQVGA
jgi:hypothetical protein